MAQMFAFELKPGESRLNLFFFCTLASVIDMSVTIGIYRFLLKLLIQTNRFGFYLTAAFVGAWCAVFFEWFARYFNLWSYNRKMLVIPLLETGLLPFLQMTLLVPLAVWLTRKMMTRQQFRDE